MATQNPQIVPIAFKSQQLPFFFGGSQVPTSYIDLTVPLPPKKKQKITHYYKKKPEVVDLVNDSDSSSDDEPIIFKKTKGRSRMIPALTELERRRMEQAMKEADDDHYKEIHRKNQELKRKYSLYRF